MSVTNNKVLTKSGSYFTFGVSRIFHNPQDYFILHSNISLTVIYCSKRKKIIYIQNREKYETKIGEDGKAEKERHHTTHKKEHTGHTDPHDHIIDWSKNFPDLSPPINYPVGDFPEFKNWRGADNMNIFSSGFESISDFKWCMKCHGEVEFVWKGKSYSIVHVGDKINIGEGYYTDSNGVRRNAESHEPCIDFEGMYADTADEILEYTIDGDKLRDIITEIKVEVRTI